MLEESAHTYYAYDHYLTIEGKIHPVDADTEPGVIKLRPTFKRKPAYVTMTPELQAALEEPGYAMRAVGDSCVKDDEWLSPSGNWMKSGLWRATEFSVIKPYYAPVRYRRVLSEGDRLMRFFFGGK